MIDPGLTPHGCFASQAIQDSTGGVPTSAEQQSMLSSWRRMVAKREAELRRSRARSLDRDSWVPAYLTSFSDEDSLTSLSDGETDEVRYAYYSHSILTESAVF